MAVSDSLLVSRQQRRTRIVTVAQVAEFTGVTPGAAVQRAAVGLNTSIWA